MAALQDVLSALYLTLSGSINCISGQAATISSLSGELDGLKNLVMGGIDYEAIQDTIVFNSKPAITTLSGDTSYELEDGKCYRAELSYDADFILPDVSDANVWHELNLTVKFDGAYLATFKDTLNHELTPLDENEWDNGDVVQYLCRYENYLSKWVIMPVRVS